jgi:hypothetical protein
MDVAIGRVKIDGARGVISKYYITDCALNDRGCDRRWLEIGWHHASNLAFNGIKRHSG